MLFDFADHELCTQFKGQCRSIKIKPSVYAPNYNAGLVNMYKFE